MEYWPTDKIHLVKIRTQAVYRTSSECVLLDHNFNPQTLKLNEWIVIHVIG